MPNYTVMASERSIPAFAIAAGSAVINSTEGNFSAADAGKAIRVMGANTSSTPLETTVLSVQSATSATLAAPAVVKVDVINGRIAYVRPGANL